MGAVAVQVAAATFMIWKLESVGAAINYNGGMAIYAVTFKGCSRFSKR